MTELYERLLTDRHEALAKRRTVYFTRTRRIVTILPIDYFI